MDPSHRYLPTPGAPLHPVSPERANQQKHSQRPEISISPSLPNINGYVQATMMSSSDVPGKVAQFNSLDGKDVMERRRVNDAALKRAVLGREEAESETRRVKEMVQTLTDELEVSKQREGKFVRRLERALEELHHYKEKLQQTKETHLHYQNMYEKEIRRTRKEAFKSSSALVRLQEELKGTRESLARMRSKMEEQKCKTEEREKEAFAASYKLVEVQQELAKTVELKALYEEEKVELENKLLTVDMIKNEEIGTLAAEYQMALEENERKTASVEQQGGHEEEKLAELEQELRWAKEALKDVEGQVEFMKIECQFRCCSCRVAERKGVTYEYDTQPFMDEVLASMKEMEESLARIHHREDDDDAGDMPRITEDDDDDQQPDTDISEVTETQEVLISDENLTEVAFCPQTGTFHSVNNTTTQQVISIEHSSDDVINKNNNTTTLIHIEAEEPILPSTRLESIPDLPPTLPAVSIPALLPDQSSLLSLLSSPARSPAETEEDEESGPRSEPDPRSSPSTAFSPFPKHQQQHHPHHQHRTITTTTRIPLADSPRPTQHTHNQPKTPSQPHSLQSSEDEDEDEGRGRGRGERAHDDDDDDDQSLLAGTTMTRQQAIEQIRLRRGRARSIAAGALTPRRQMVDAQGPGLGNRRDISAPGGEKGRRRWDD
ncbi:MAG: hypothetical protein M1816_005958 [Peltula sp. TS41687]|nr:MAG: hypothetical protein M1816_005958 [Peltula sp. TS41687]